MNHYNDLSDEYYVNVNLGTALDLPSNRDTLLHHFEQLRKRFPSMSNFYNRESGESAAVTLIHLTLKQRWNNTAWCSMRFRIRCQ